MGLDNTVVVTGGAGYIGLAVCAELVKQGYRPLVIDNFSTGDKQALYEIVDPQDVFCRPIEGLETIDVDQIIEYWGHPVAMIHLAAKTSVAESEQRPVRYYETNLLGTYKVLDLALKLQIPKFIFASTAAVYGPAFGAEERQALYPENIYGRTKADAEYAVKNYRKGEGMDRTILRLFNIAGAWQHNGKYYGAPKDSAAFIQKLVATAVAGSNFWIYGNGETVRDFTHVSDVARVFVKAIRTYTKDSVFNVARGRPYSLTTVVDTFLSICARRRLAFKVDNANALPGNVEMSYGDTMLLTQQLAYNCEMTLGDILNSELEYRLQLDAASLK